MDNLFMLADCSCWSFLRKYPITKTNNKPAATLHPATSPSVSPDESSEGPDEGENEGEFEFVELLSLYTSSKARIIILSTPRMTRVV
jgi:hypothetical protein